MIRFRTTASLPGDSCPMSIAAWEPEIHSAIERSSPSPAQQTYTAWNQCISGKFFLILRYILSSGLSYMPVFIFCVNSLLTSKDMPGRKLHVTLDAINCWISNNSYVRTEDSVKMEQDISYRRSRTKTERKLNLTQMEFHIIQPFSVQPSPYPLTLT